MQDQITPEPDGNQTVYTLDDLSKRLKRTVESVFDHVRVRAEVSRPTRAASGHLYFTLKDDSATLDAVCWKGVAAGLTTMPEEGLEVVVTGKISTFPGRSKYQIVVQDVEIAGEGAILKQLEGAAAALPPRGCLTRKKTADPVHAAGDRCCHQSHRGGDPRYSASAERAFSGACAGLARACSR